MISAKTGLAGWRLFLIASFAVGSLAAIFFIEPIPQDLAYHDFADVRQILGIPNTLDVLSNVFFLIVGFIGIRTVQRTNELPSDRAWLVFFTGVLLVGAGSAYYHLAPGNSTLVWDRLPMTVGFMGLLVALVSEFGRLHLGPLALLAAVLVGAASVVYWAVTDDLRFYAWVQFMPLGLFLLLLLFCRSAYSQTWLLAVSLACYVAAKLFEYFDKAIFEQTGNTVSGHTLKHLAAALGCYILAIYLSKRRIID